MDLLNPVLVTRYNCALVLFKFPAGITYEVSLTKLFRHTHLVALCLIMPEHYYLYSVQNALTSPTTC